MNSLLSLSVLPATWFFSLKTACVNSFQVPLLQRFSVYASKCIYVFFLPPFNITIFAAVHFIEKFSGYCRKKMPLLSLKIQTLLNDMQRDF